MAPARNNITIINNNNGYYYYLFDNTNGGTFSISGVNNFNINTSNGTGNNWGIVCYNDQSLQSQITNEFFGGVVSSQGAVDYSVFNDPNSKVIDRKSTRLNSSHT